MTIVVALKDKNDVVVGSDSMTTIGNVFIDKGEAKFIVKKISCYGETDIKIVIGLAGNPTVNKYMEHVFEPPKYDLKQDFYKYLLDKFIPSFKKLLKDKSYIKEEDKVPDNRSELIILYGNRVFEMFYNFDTIERDGEFTTIGSGWEVAIGSLFSTKDKSSEERVKIAIGAAISNTVYCGGKIWVNRVSELTL